MEDKKVENLTLPEDKNTRPSSSLSDDSNCSYHSLTVNTEHTENIEKDTSPGSTDNEEEIKFSSPDEDFKGSDKPNPIDELLDKENDDNDETEGHDEYFIDEEYLKDLELNLSDEDKIVS